MPTHEQARTWAKDFEREYPEALPDRLRWLNQTLGIRPGHLLRLMGATREQVRDQAAGGVDWHWAVREFGEDAASWAIEVIMGPLRLYHYDWRGFKERLEQPVPNEFLILLPGGRAVPVSEFPAEERESRLLHLIAEGGSRGRQALIAYLSQPELASVCS